MLLPAPRRVHGGARCRRARGGASAHHSDATVLDLSVAEEGERLIITHGGLWGKKGGAPLSAQAASIGAAGDVQSRRMLTKPTGSKILSPVSGPTPVLPGPGVPQG